MSDKEMALLADFKSLKMYAEMEILSLSDHVKKQKCEKLEEDLAAPLTRTHILTGEKRSWNRELSQTESHQNTAFP